MKPPTRLARTSPPPSHLNRPEGPVGRQAKRAALIQCSGCHAIGTALLAGNAVRSSNLRIDWQRGRPRHVCGGTFSAYDTKGEA